MIDSHCHALLKDQGPYDLPRWRSFFTEALEQEIYEQHVQYMAFYLWSMTQLAEEFGVYAGLRGAQVLTGHCYEGESSLPYRPFVEAFRQYTRSRPDAERR